MGKHVMRMYIVYDLHLITSFTYDLFNRSYPNYTTNFS
jgi:hypothetical protein